MIYRRIKKLNENFSENPGTREAILVAFVDVGKAFEAMEILKLIGVKFKNGRFLENVQFYTINRPQ